MADKATTKTPARKPAARATSRSATARKAAATRKANATKRSTTAKKAAQTRAANREDSRNAVKSPVARIGGLAETAVLVPVGVTLVTGERVLAAVGDVRATYSTRKKAEGEMRRYERRATTALRSVERDMSRTRERVGSDLRSGRTRVEKEVRAVIQDIEARTSPVVRNANVFGARVENVVQSGRSAATRASTTVQERLGAIA